MIYAATSTTACDTQDNTSGISAMDGVITSTAVSMADNRSADISLPVNNRGGEDIIINSSGGSTHYVPTPTPGYDCHTGAPTSDDMEGVVTFPSTSGVHGVSNLPQLTTIRLGVCLILFSLGPRLLDL